jgi:hypothetical protein
MPSKIIVTKNCVFCIKPFCRFYFLLAGLGGTNSQRRVNTTLNPVPTPNAPAVPSLASTARLVNAPKKSVIAAMRRWSLDITRLRICNKLGSVTSSTQTVVNTTRYMRQQSQHVCTGMVLECKQKLNWSSQTGYSTASPGYLVAPSSR